MYAEVTHSEVSSGMAPWYELLQRSKDIPPEFKRVGSKATPICQGANGKVL